LPLGVRTREMGSYWRPWVRQARTRPLRWLYSFTLQAQVWGVLGVTRLHATIMTGEVISKSAAGPYAMENFPSCWAPLIQNVLAGRLGDRPAPYNNPFARRSDALGCMEYVIQDAIGT
jgi:hypothetical protein